ncbi:MAG: hypothetical protein H7832_14835 [Magnetococcus sp. DMHC-6]
MTFNPQDPAIVRESTRLVRLWTDAPETEVTTRLNVAQLVEAFANEWSQRPSILEEGLLQLEGYHFIKKWRFKRYYRSALFFVWQQAIIWVKKEQAHRIVAQLDFAFFSKMGMSRKEWVKMENDLIFFSMLLDNMKEEGLISLGCYLTQRVLGALDKDPNRLRCSVALTMHLEQRLDVFKEQAERTVL